MKNIKVNLTNGDGIRTSTTINGTIANFYYEHVCQKDLYNSIDEYLKTIINVYGLTTKQDIEQRILLAIHDYEPKQKFLDF